VQVVNSNGNVLQHYIYSAFGELLNPVEDDMNPFRHNGEYWDAETRSNEYIPTASTVYYKPETEQEMTTLMKLGDMIHAPWVFQSSGSLWYTMGMNDETDPKSMCLFPNIILSKESLQPLTRWGMARMTYLKEHKKFVAAQFGVVGLHKHCLEIQEQAEERKRNIMAAIRKDPANRVTESDKAQDPMAIKAHDVQTSALIRQKENNRDELISGHRRKDV